MNWFNFYRGIALSFFVVALFSSYHVSASQLPTSSLKEIKIASSSQPLSYNTFKKYLSLGSIGEDVKLLQKFLNNNHQTIVASSGPGSYNNETTYFGKATQDAVIRYQKLHNLQINGEFTHEMRIYVNNSIVSQSFLTFPLVNDETELPELPKLGLTPNEIPIFSTKAARELGIFQGDDKKDAVYIKEESERISNVFNIPNFKTQTQYSLSNPSTSTSTSAWDSIKSFASIATNALVIRQFSGTIYKTPHFCSCTLTPVIFIRNEKGILKTFALYPVPGKTLFQSYNFFTPRVAVLGEYFNPIVKLPCLQGIPPTCTQDPTVKYIDGFITRMGTSLIPTKK